MFKDFPEAQTNFDPIAEFKAKERERFDEKYGYEYPRCALIVKKLEVRDENDELIGYTNTAAVTPTEIKSFLSESYARLIDFIEKELLSREEHICRFNDGEQKCECYYAHVSQVKAKLESIKKGIIS